MAFSWSHEGICVDCAQPVRGPRLRNGACPSCAEEPPDYVLTEESGRYGQRIAVRVPLRPKQEPRSPASRAFHRMLERRAAAEADLRWYFQQADGDLGLRAIRLETDMLAPVSLAVVRNDAGVWKPKPTRSVIVRGMTMGQLAAAGRCRRVTKILRVIPRDASRILQRRFELVYYPELEVTFGEWSGIVDYISPEVQELCRPREGRKPDVGLIAEYLEAAKIVYGQALDAYLRVA